jgi:catechol 2,3-dioxygenase-like lactoylglutathione lyase family enzyme
VEVTGVYETVLYAGDVPATANFYAEVVGLREIAGPDPTAAGFRLPDGGILLIFDPAHSSQPDRAVPSHGAAGAGHVAFRVASGTLAGCTAELRSRGIEVERELAWPAGGRSLYVRDPAGNSVELVDGEVWRDGRGAD